MLFLNCAIANFNLYSMEHKNNKHQNSIFSIKLHTDSGCKRYNSTSSKLKFKQLARCNGKAHQQYTIEKTKTPNLQFLITSSSKKPIIGTKDCTLTHRQLIILARCEFAQSA